MSEEGKSKWDQGFESFMGDVRRRTEPGRQESPRDVLAEVRENSIDGFQSHEEATAALARVQLVVEKAEEEQDDALTDEGKEALQRFAQRSSKTQKKRRSHGHGRTSQNKA